MSGPRTLLERRRVGRSSVFVSSVGLGAAPLGGLYAASSAEAALGTIAACRDAGITFIDVAPHYGQGLAETRVGAALADLGREGMVLSTKVGRLLSPEGENPPSDNWPEALPFVSVYDASEDGIRRSMLESRARMGGQRADILLLHDPDRRALGSDLQRLIAGAYRALARLRDEGEVSAIGLGVNAPEPCHLALDCGDWDCFLLAGSYSVLRQDDHGLLDRCSERGVSVLVGGPYMSGALAGGTRWRYRPIPPEVAVDLDRLREICEAHAVPMQAAALQFPLLHPAVTSVVVGMRSANEVHENMAYLASPIGAAFWDALDAAGIAPRPAARRWTQ